MPKRIIVILVIACLFLSYVAYNNHKDKKLANNKVTELVGKIDELTQRYEKQNQVIAEREQEKSADSLEVKRLQERLKDAVKNNHCANEPIPSDIINWMRDGKN